MRANRRGMWFRRRRRGATQLDLSALDRLTELVDRIVTLLPEQRVPPAPTPAPEPPPAPVVRARGPDEIEQQPGLLFVATSSGYRLVDSAAAAPAGGTRVELAGEGFRVLRVGPSPLPGDRRRCAFLEREEPSAGARTPDG